MVYIALRSGLSSKTIAGNFVAGGTFEMGTQINPSSPSYEGKRVQGTPTLPLLSQDLFKPYSHKSGSAEYVHITYGRAQAIGRAYGIVPLTS
jgi:hypothetical protein